MTDLSQVRVIEWLSAPSWELFPGAHAIIRAVEAGAGAEVSELQQLALDAMFDQQKRAEYELALADLRRRYGGSL